MLQLDSSIIWTIVGTIIGVGATVIVCLFQTKKTLLQYYISTTPLITEKMAAILNDRMSIDGHPVKSMSSTTISFINSGNQRIKSSDFSEQEPLRIIFKGHLYGHDVSLGNQKLLPKVAPVNDNVLNILFENLKPGQFFRVIILHDETDEADKTLEVLGELTTGTMREFSSKFKAIAPFIATILMIAVMFASYIVSDYFYDSHIMETILSSTWGLNILVGIPLLSLLLILYTLLKYKESFLRYDDINGSIKKGPKLLEIISHIFHK